MAGAHKRKVEVFFGGGRLCFPSDFSPVISARMNLPLNAALKNLPVYQPGRPIEEVARELGMPAGDIIKLASNENPFGPSPLALAAMETALKQRFRNRPMHLFGGMGLLFVFVGSLISAYLAVLKFMGRAIGSRPLLLLGVLLIVVGVQLVTVGLLSELLQRNHLRRAIDETEMRIERVVGGDD